MYVKITICLQLQFIECMHILWAIAISVFFLLLHYRIWVLVCFPKTSCFTRCWASQRHASHETGKDQAGGQWPGFIIAKSYESKTNNKHKKHSNNKQFIHTFQNTQNLSTSIHFMFRCLNDLFVSNSGHLPSKAWSMLGTHMKTKEYLEVEKSQRPSPSILLNNTDVGSIYTSNTKSPSQLTENCSKRAKVIVTPSCCPAHIDPSNKEFTAPVKKIRLSDVMAWHKTNAELFCLTRLQKKLYWTSALQ